MTIKQLLVHVDNSSSSTHRLKAAIMLANQHASRIKSVHIVPDYIIPAYFEAQISPDIIDEASRKALNKARDSQDLYDSIVSDAGCSMDAFIEEGNLISKLGEHAHFCDLVILGQSQPDDPDNLSEALADNVVLDGGTPCLVVPYEGIKDSLGKCILVAWNATRESARAIKDALPLLAQAERVEILIINPEHYEIEENENHGHSIQAFLAQHGITADVRIDPSKDSKPGEAILARASEIEADMIVMGAYGHSRLRELVLGGTTRVLLKHMNVPILISH